MKNCKSKDCARYGNRLSWCFLHFKGCKSKDCELLNGEIDCLGNLNILWSISPRIVSSLSGNRQPWLLTLFVGYKSKDCVRYGNRLSWLSIPLGSKSRDCELLKWI